MSDESSSLRFVASELVRHGPALYAAGSERRARWLADAFQELACADSELGRELRLALVFRAGLSESMVEWAVRNALAPLNYEALRQLERSPQPPSPHAVRVRAGQLCVVVLAGNVAIAPARAIAVPLLFGWPVLAKASSDDDALAHLLEAALTASDPELARAYRAITFGSEHEALGNALFEQADAVSVYGSDATVNAVRAQLGATVSFAGHGHGLGAAFVARGTLDGLEAARAAARRLALDVAAYDQRGCLSPHVAWVEREGSVTARAFAELVYEELAALSTTLPRGSLPPASASAQLSWRGVSAIRGTLLEGDGFAVAYEESGAMRVSPGYRNLQVIGISGMDELTSKLAPLGVHLKSLGVAGIEVAALLSALPVRVAPRVCELGEMQRPPLAALQDGLAPWDGLLRWADASPALRPLSH